MRRAGVGVKDRRYVLESDSILSVYHSDLNVVCSYILWSLEKFRQGHDPADFAHPERPKKKIRG
jgi:hypothetical protein